MTAMDRSNRTVLRTICVGGMNKHALLAEFGTYGIKLKRGRADFVCT